MAWLFRIIMATIAMAAVTVWFSPEAGSWSSWAVHERLINLTTLIVTAIAAYILVLWVQGVRPSQLRRTR
jgi:peptidoglycan biosynthesis protein MviN/MurJ (putative lipid II flippase)